MQTALPWPSRFALFVCVGVVAAASLLPRASAQASTPTSAPSPAFVTAPVAFPGLTEFPDHAVAAAQFQLAAAASLPNAPGTADGTTIPAAPAFSLDSPYPTPEQAQSQSTSQSPSQSQSKSTDPAYGVPDDYKQGQQTKRILFIVPNFRSVSVDAKLPPLTPKQKFGLAVSDSFDYSSFIYVGMLAGVDFAENETPEFHQGAAGYARYYWHDFADNTIGNFFTEAIVPSITHEDPRYYTLGRGGLFKRTYYAVSRLVITRRDGDPNRETFNLSEIIGNGAGAGISNLYYPSQERTWTKTGQKWLLEIGLDGASNILKEFWPDVAHGLFHADKASVAPEGAPAPAKPSNQ
jgi:hypothetical protein